MVPTTYCTQDQQGSPVNSQDIQLYQRLRLDGVDDAGMVSLDDQRPPTPDITPLRVHERVPKAAADDTHSVSNAQHVESQKITAADGFCAECHLPGKSHPVNSGLSIKVNLLAHSYQRNNDTYEQVSSLITNDVELSPSNSNGQTIPPRYERKLCCLHGITGCFDVEGPRSQENPRHNCNGSFQCRLHMSCTCGRAFPRHPRSAITSGKVLPRKALARGGTRLVNQQSSLSHASSCRPFSPNKEKQARQQFSSSRTRNLFTSASDLLQLASFRIRYNSQGMIVDHSSP